MTEEDNIVDINEEEEEEGSEESLQALQLIGLAPDESKAYFKISGRGPVMVGEIALLIKVSEERGLEIAENLLEKGLVRKIPGKTPHYTALPPYVALLNQIRQFKESVINLQQSVPKSLESKFANIEQQSGKLQKFEEYKQYVIQMKEVLPARMGKQFKRFEKELEQVKRFQEVKSFILNLKQIVPNEVSREFEKMGEKLEVIKSMISEDFEKKLRLPHLKAMAEKTVDRIISTQFLEISEAFKNKFVQTTQNMLDQVVDQLGSITDTAGDLTSDLENTFGDISKGLKTTLGDLEVRITEVYDDIMAGISELKASFHKGIFETLRDDVMENIIKQLDASEITMREFWERSKKASMLTFKDVWFVRSFEGMRAQINESISRVKMRIYIICPRLQNIDMVAVTGVKKFINVRIATNFDSSDPEDKRILAKIDEYHNISIRHYPRENVWSINKDHEEVVLCVVSKSGEGELEIAGMGSILEEHIKLFAVVLEDIWIQSRKMGSIGFRR